MTARTIAGVMLVFSPDEQATADLIAAACEEAIQLAREMWGLDPPENCRVHVMTSWLGFVFRSAPWAWRILLAPTLPLWCWRTRRAWPYSAGWTQRYGRRVAIGVKPARLLAASQRSIGVRMFVEEPDMTVNVQHVTCHELVHACAADLKPPMWLNEGIATVTVDRFLGRATIRPETLDLLQAHSPKAPPPTYRELSRLGLDALAYHASRAYWLVRYLEEVRPGFLKGLFGQRPDGGAIEREMALELGMDTVTFWTDIDGVVVRHFGGHAAATP